MSQVDLPDNNYQIFFENIFSVNYVKWFIYQCFTPEANIEIYDALLRKLSNKVKREIEIEILVICFMQTDS